MTSKFRFATLCLACAVLAGFYLRGLAGSASVPADRGASFLQMAKMDSPGAGERHSGAWYDPSHEGEGVVLEVLDDGQAVLYWFTYDGQGDQRWFIATGHFDGGDLVFEDLIVTSGGRFGDRFDSSRVTRQSVGEARLSFDDCWRARLDYVVDATPGRLDLERLTIPAGSDCSGGSPDATTAGVGYSGSWFDLSHDGEGFVVQVLDEATAVVFWFTYRPNGRQAWLIGVGSLDDEAVVVDPLLITRGATFGESFSPSDVRMREWGRLALDLTCETATVRYESSLEHFGSGVQNLVRLNRLKGLHCTEAQAAVPPSTVAADTPVAFTNVNLVPMNQLAVLADRTVLVANGLVSAVGNAGEVAIPENAVRIDGRGRFLMPGLADMHVHLGRSDLKRYLDSGVTTVRNMWGFPDIQAMQAEIRAGALDGPTIYSTSPGLDASPATWPFTQFVDEPSRADSVVALQEDNGWDTLKVYQKLSLASYDAIVRSAKARGMAFVGHTPTAVGLRRVLEAGQSSIEHLGGYERVLNGLGIRGPAGWARASADGMGALAGQTAEHGVWNCPTLAIQLNMGQQLPNADRERGARNRRLMVKALHDAGAGLLVGTDSGIGITVPGASIHAELAEFTRAGLSPYQALSGATSQAADFLGASGEFGVVQAGARADLILLEDNPLLDLEALRRPVGVMVRGQWKAME